MLRCRSHEPGSGEPQGSVPGERRAIFRLQGTRSAHEEQKSNGGG